MRWSPSDEMNHNVCGKVLYHSVVKVGKWYGLERFRL